MRSSDFGSAANFVWVYMGSNKLGKYDQLYVGLYWEMIGNNV